MWGEIGGDLEAVKKSTPSPSFERGEGTKGKSTPNPSFEK